METKEFWKSKIFWAGVITTLISILELFAEWYKAGNFDVPAIITLIVGILIIIFRIWFTNTIIKGG